MAYTVVWSPRAINDVDSIAAYIAEDSKAYAASVVRLILVKARNLSDFPYIGRVVPEFDREYIREVFAYSYRIIYEIAGDKVTIAAVIHGSRMLELAIKPWEFAGGRPKVEEIMAYFPALIPKRLIETKVEIVDA